MNEVIPKTMTEIRCIALNNDMRRSTKVVKNAPVPVPGPNQCLVKTNYLCVIPTDILFVAGLYNKDADSLSKPPFRAGLEGMGTIVKVGEGSKFKVGQYVCYYDYGVYSEYVALDESILMPVDNLDPQNTVFTTSVVTSLMVIDKKANLKKGETVMVTAAAGAIGHIAVQLAKNAGCHVIGTCSSDDKIALLKSIGCDRPINYTKENLHVVLTKEYPKGIDFVYESCGGELFDIAVKNVATKGRIAGVGSTSNYTKKTWTRDVSQTNLPVALMQKSADFVTFLYPHYKSEYATYYQKGSQLGKEGKLKPFYDDGSKTPNGKFKGWDGIYDAIEYLYSRKSQGKIVVEICK